MTLKKDKPSQVGDEAEAEGSVLIQAQVSKFVTALRDSSSSEQHTKLIGMLPEAFADVVDGLATTLTHLPSYSINCVEYAVTTLWTNMVLNLVSMWY